MADAKQKWQGATAEILSKLDIEAEYLALGVKLAGSKPTQKGWMYCHATDRPDENRSCGFNVGDDPRMRGRFKDFSGATPGQTWSFFAFAAERCGLFGGDWKEARKHYARQVGVKLPDGSEELVADRFEWSGDPTAGTLLHFSREKAGVKAKALMRLGVKAARWPKGLPIERQNLLLAFPMYGDKLLNLEPTGWHCVSQNPKFKIRKFRGKGNEPELIKTMTAGDYGLMNPWALSHWNTAKIVWIVEGISDLLALQSAMLDLDEATQSQHVVVSSGGCSYHPRPEWPVLFAGKDCRLVFDVGDKDGAGDAGAKVWVGSLVKTADNVRNVKLPLGKDGGKNDLRAWLAGIDGNTPHTYADLCDLAETFEPVSPDDAAEQASHHDLILKQLKIVVLGEHEGSHAVEIFSEALRKSTTIKQIDRLSVPTLIQHAGSEVVDKHVNRSKDAQPGMMQINEVKEAIAHAAANKVYRPDGKCGAGVWEIGSDIVLVKARDAFRMDYQPTGAKLERLESPVVGNNVLDLGLANGEWFDTGELQRLLRAARDTGWCQDQLNTAYQLFGKWFWRQRSAPKVLASLACCAWVQTLWEWRPQVALSGSTATGKSMLFEDVLRRMFDTMARYALKPSEAAIRQKMTEHHARVVIIDEFESSHHRQKVYEMFRVAGRGGDVIRGTQDQHGAQFRIRHMPFYAAIELGQKKGADRNRYIMLDLEEIPPDRQGMIELPTHDALRSLGHRLLAVALVHQAEARRLAGILGTHRHEGVPGRVVENFAVPVAMHAVATGMDDQGAAEWMTAILGDWDFAGQRTSDHLELLSEIFAGGPVDVSARERMSVHQCLNNLGTPGVRPALARVGVAKVIKKSGKLRGQSVLFLAHKIVSQTLLKPNGDFGGQAIDVYLLRVSGSKRGSQKLGGDVPIPGVEIPWDAVKELFAREVPEGEAEADEQEGDQPAQESGNDGF